MKILHHAKFVLWKEKIWNCFFQLSAIYRNPPIERCYRVNRWIFNRNWIFIRDAEVVNFLNRCFFYIFLQISMGSSLHKVPRLKYTIALASLLHGDNAQSIFQVNPRHSPSWILKRQFVNFDRILIWLGVVCVHPWYCHSSRELSWNWRLHAGETEVRKKGREN